MYRVSSKYADILRSVFQHIYIKKESYLYRNVSKDSDLGVTSERVLCMDYSALARFSLAM
jgi:hypothetical protein